LSKTSTNEDKMPVSNSLSNLNDSTKKIGRKFLGLAQYKPQKLSAIRDKVAKVVRNKPKYCKVLPKGTLGAGNSAA
jgi:hypothetical protein